MQRKLLYGFILVCLCAMAKAQQAADVKKILTAISHNYDTSTNISFGVRITTITEPDSGKVTSDKVEGAYALKGKKAFYTLGDIEAMQNDSLFVGVYNKDHLIIATDTKGRNSNTGFFPFRETMDSLIKLSAEKYTINTVLNEEAKKGKISFEAKDPKETVRKFIVEYDTKQGLFTSLSYMYNEYKTLANNTGEEVTVLLKKTMRIEFFEYNHTVLDEALFKGTTYMNFNGKYEPAEKYKGFQLYYDPLPVVK